ncbi:uncharacterized protein LOC127284885 [Leptopilina boulardi]|uniref:uncharacterized protein LOC127284885 n=1 Tax=Leptopilina boulardi TaxID=63433 RepID=UPI0021F649AC|nr:uncharacterized protein LOC127284885 [Leptopilina boulardi]
MDKWQSEDKIVTKEILKKNNFTDKPTERAVCQLKIGKIDEIQFTIDKLMSKFPSDIIYESNEKTWILGDGCTELDRQIERAIPTMFIDETSLITVKIVSNNKNDKTENENIVKFELTLVNFQSFKPIWQWTPEEKYEIALNYKESGVKLFKLTRYIDAFYKFSKACKILITLEPINDLNIVDDNKNLLKNIHNLRIHLYNNIAECHMHRENYDYVIILCNKVLNCDVNNVKALYRRGVAYGNLQNFDNAVEDLKKVLQLEPNNFLVKAKFHFYKQQSQIENKKYEEMVKRMFVYEK